jgi:hypothetical protein
MEKRLLISAAFFLAQGIEKLCRFLALIVACSSTGKTGEEHK